MSWSTSELRVRLAPLNRFKPSSKIFYWPFQGSTSFVDHLCFSFCLVFALFLCASVSMCFVVTCWERADLLALVCGVYLWVCHFPICILGQVWYLIVSIPDLCTLTYFILLLQLKLHTILPKQCFRFIRQKCGLNRNHIPNYLISIMLLLACSITNTITFAIMRKHKIWIFRPRMGPEFFQGIHVQSGRQMRPLFACQGYAI